MSTDVTDVTRMPTSPEALRRLCLAYHQAGHAAAAHALGWEVGLLSFTPDGDAYVQYRPVEQLGEAQRWKMTAIIMLAGSVAEAARGLPLSPDSQRDREEVSDIATHRFPASPQKQAAFIAQAERAAQEILRKPRYRRAVHALVEALVRHGQLSPEQSEAILSARRSAI